MAKLLRIICQLCAGCWCTTLDVSLSFNWFLLYPLFHRWVPSMLRRLGAGLFLTLVGYTLCVASLAKGYDQTTGYLTCNKSHISPDDSVECYWKLCPLVVYGVGSGLTYVTLLEFIIAAVARQNEMIYFWIDACILWYRQRLCWDNAGFLGSHLMLWHCGACSTNSTAPSLPLSLQTVHTTWEEQRDQHPDHSGRTLWEVPGPWGGVHEGTALSIH